MAAAAPRVEQLAAQLLTDTRHDPYGFVVRAFPWGVAGTILADKTGPREWQKRELIALGQHLQGPNRFEPFRLAIASGHGIGKSTFIAWLTLWGTCTMVNTRGVITANTEAQLRTKTWPELRKWYGLMAVRPWFQVDNTVFRSSDAEHALTWRIDATPWSENNTEAFAGLHNEGVRILALFDESSAIADRVFEVAEGALTDANTEIIIVCLGNPTRPTGRFHSMFTRLKHRWRTANIDSRTVEGTNKRQLQEWVEDFGEDSDFVRVRVRGEFPKSAVNQLISSDLIEAARERDTAPSMFDPLVFGIDVARFGDDQSVLMTRKGKAAGIYGVHKWRGYDMVQLADAIIPIILEFKPAYVFIDGGGVGGGLVDILRHRGFNVTEINFGSSARNPDYRNKRTEMWHDMRDWMKSGGSIPWQDTDLAEDLKNQTYSVPESKLSAVLLTPKEIMKRDGIPSPDAGDALALTFAEVVSPVIHPKETTVIPFQEVETDYVRGWR